MEHYIEILKRTIAEKWDSPALCDYKGVQFTYGQFASRMMMLHSMYRAAGVTEDDKVALAARNCARWALTYISTNAYNAIAVTILNDFLPNDIAQLVNHSDAKVVFTDLKIWEQMDKNLMPNLEVALDSDSFKPIWAKDEQLKAKLDSIVDQAEDVVSMGDWEAASSLFNTGNLDKIIAINYTSGTTGNPKGIQLTARNISSNVVFALEKIPISENPRILSMLPLAHMYGLAFELLYPVTGGCAVYFLGKTPTPSLLLSALKDIRPYIMITVPLVIEKIFKGSVMPKLQTPLMKILTRTPIIKGIIFRKIGNTVMTLMGGNLTQIIMGGAALNSTVEALLHKCGIPYTVGYGMTECAPLISYAPSQTYAQYSCGRPVDRMKVRIDSEDPHHKTGEIQVKGDNVMVGYYKNEEATKAAFTADGWLRSGDLGLMDTHGNIFIKGRSKCMILSSSGQNIYPEEIEAILSAMPLVSDSIVIDRAGKLVGIVALMPDAEKMTKEQIEDQMNRNLVDLNKRLPGYSRLIRIETISGDFERTPKKSIKRFLYK